MEKFYNSPLLGELFYKDVLMYYEKPLLFTAINDLEYLYLCLLSVDEIDSQQWLMAPITFKERKELLNGKKLIKSVFSENKHLVYLVKCSLGEYQENMILPSNIPHHYLPADDLCLDFLNETCEESNDDILKLTLEERRSILDIRIIDKKNPNIHEVPLKDLAPLLGEVSHLSYTLARYNPQISNKFPAAEIKKKTQLNMALTYAGSFGIRFKTNEIADLLNEDMIIQQIFSDMFLLIGEDEHEFSTILSNRKSKAINACRRFLNEIVKEKYDFEFKYALPDCRYKKTYIDKEKIKDRLKSLNTFLENKEEIYDFRGYIIGGKLDKGNFEFISEDGERMSGRIDNKGLKNFLVLDAKKIVDVKIRVKMTQNSYYNEIKEEYALVDIKD